MESVTKRLLEKKADYQHYSFTEAQNNAFKAFFDLAQEFESFEEFYALCADVPKVFLDTDARLFAPGLAREGTPVLVASSLDQELYTSAPGYVRSCEEVYFADETGGYVFPVRGKVMRLNDLPFDASENMLGLLEVIPKVPLSVGERLFFQKYANRIGYSMHNRFLSTRNVEHLKFISNLVADIEHNVITPNMVYKLYLRNLKGLVDKNREVERLLSDYLKDAPELETVLRALHGELVDVNRGFWQEFRNIDGHYKNTSLFLETLLRRSHFDQGRLIARKKVCNMKKDVIAPQLERYLDKFRAAGIDIDDRLSHVPEEETISVVDIGLMAQVYANLFSNAIKYAQPSSPGDPSAKRVSYGRELIPDFFGEGQDGIKYNVFSTGPHLSGEIGNRIFDDGFRGPNSKGKPGAGHGLSFVKNVVELHYGTVGYEATAGGNNFYFVLPPK